MVNSYKARQFNLSNLQGISDETLEMHFKLYEGYVKETNKLNEKIAEFVKDAKVDQEEFAEYSELTRRLGFEYNGMVLHEYYFDNLKTAGGTGDPNNDSAFRRAAEQSFGNSKTESAIAASFCRRTPKWTKPRLSGPSVSGCVCRPRSNRCLRRTLQYTSDGRPVCNRAGTRVPKRPSPAPE